MCEREERCEQGCAKSERKGGKQPKYKKMCKRDRCVKACTQVHGRKGEGKGKGRKEERKEGKGRKRNFYYWII